MESGSVRLFSAGLAWSSVDLRSSVRPPCYREWSLNLGLDQRAGRRCMHTQEHLLKLRRIHCRRSVAHPFRCSAMPAAAALSAR